MWECVGGAAALCGGVFSAAIALLHIMAIGYGKYRLHRKVEYPPGGRGGAGVSILKPIVGVDEHLEKNLESYFLLKYHMYELLFCLHERSDPAVEVIRRLMHTYPAVPASIFYLEDSASVGLNPKINNMAAAWRAAKHPLVLISDSGIMMRPDALQDMVNSMTPEVALVTQTPFCADRSGSGAEMEQIFFGTAHSRIYLAANCLGFLCSTGMSSIMRKDAVDSCGGLSHFGQFLAEDYFIGLALTNKGWKSAISSLPALQNSARVTPLSFHNRLCRWIKLRVAMLPHTIVLEPLQDCFVNALMTAVCVRRLFGWYMCAYLPLHLGAWLACDWVLLNVLQNGPLPFSFPRFVRLWLCREAMALPTFLRALLQPDIEWRRGAYRLDWGGTIRPVGKRVE